MAFCLDEERNQAWRRFDHGAVVCAVCCVYLHEIDDQERWNMEQQIKDNVYDETLSEQEKEKLKEVAGDLYEEVEKTSK